MDKNPFNKPLDFSSSGKAELKPEFLLRFISAQVGQLQLELPGIISDAVVSPANQEAVRNAPGIALNFRLDRPLQYYLRTGNKLSTDQVLLLRGKIQKLKDEIPNLRDHAILAPYVADLERAAVLDEILASLFSQLDGIISSLYQSITF